MLKFIHVFSAILSFSAFSYRAYFVLVKGQKAGKVAARLRDVIDTVLLVSAISLAWTMGLNPLVHGWIGAKIGLLLAVIVFAVLGMKSFVKQPERSRVYYALAFLSYILIFTLALTKPG